MGAVRNILRGVVWGLFLALLLAALALGSGYTEQRRLALLLALAACPVVWKGLPWLTRRLSALGAAKVWLLLTVLCLAVKSAWVLWAQVPPEGDYATFWGYAQALAEEETLTGARYMALFPHLFGYASFLGRFVALFGAGQMLAPALNVALTALSGSFLFLLGRRFWGIEGGSAAYLLWIACPSQTVYNSLVLSEPLYTALLLLFLWLVTGPLPRRAGRCALLGAGAGLVLRWFNGVRPIGAVPLIALFLWRCCLAPDGLGEKGVRRRWLAFLGVLLAVYLAAGPLWSGHIASRIGEEPSSAPGYSVLVGFNPDSGGQWNPEDSELLYAYSDAPGATAQDAQQAALEAARERIAGGMDFFALFREKVRVFLGSDSACVGYCSSVVRHTKELSLACDGFYYLLLLLAGAAGGVLWRRGEGGAALLCPLYVLGLTSAQMLVEVAGRYHYSLLPVLILAIPGALAPGEGKKISKTGGKALDRWGFFRYHNQAPVKGCTLR